MNYFIELLIGILGNLVACVMIMRYKSMHYRIWCEYIIRLAARLLPEEQRDARLDEWCKHLEDTVGMRACFEHALGCLISVHAVARNAKAPVVPVRKARHVAARPENHPDDIKLLNDLTRAFDRCLDFTSSLEREAKKLANSLQNYPRPIRVISVIVMGVIVAWFVKAHFGL